MLIIRRSNCIIQHLVSSHSLGGRPVGRMSKFNWFRKGKVVRFVNKVINFGFLKMYRISWLPKEILVSEEGLFPMHLLLGFYIYTKASDRFCVI